MARLQLVALLVVVYSQLLCCKRVNLDLRKNVTKNGSRHPGRQLVRFCYYNVPRMSDKPYSVFPEVLNTTICTHIVVRSAKLGGNFTLQPQDLEDVQFYTRTIKLKKQNPKLKVLLSLESVNDDTGQDFVRMITSRENRAKFLVSALTTLKEYGFDGLEITWKFPCYTGPSEQKELFTEFLREFRNATSELILTAAVSADKGIIDIAYDIPGIAGSLDYVILMSYDYHTFTWLSPITGPNSPLFHMKDEEALLATLNVAWSANYWYENGMPASKIVVSIPTYGRSYTLMEADHNAYYSLAKGVGETGHDGQPSFEEVCTFLNHPNVTLVKDNVTDVPYAFAGSEWISFEYEASAQTKAFWIYANGFGGAAIKDLNSDDPYKLCRTEKCRGRRRLRRSCETRTAFPITQSVYEAFQKISNKKVKPRKRRILNFPF